MFPEYKRETADNDLSNMLQIYGESLELLADIDPQIVESAFKDQIEKLHTAQDGHREQVATTKAAQSHYRIFARERKFAHALWAQELLDSLK